VRVGHVFDRHRGKLGISPAMAAEAGRHCRRDSCILRVALGAGHARRNMLVDEKAVAVAGWRRRLRKRVQDKPLSETDNKANHSD